MAETSTKLLSTEQITEGLKSVTGWKLEDKAITRQLVFKNFREAISFLVLIAFDAEEADHHPDDVGMVVGFFGVEGDQHEK